MRSTRKERIIETLKYTMRHKTNDNVCDTCDSHRIIQNKSMCTKWDNLHFETSKYSSCVYHSKIKLR